MSGQRGAVSFVVAGLLVVGTVLALLLVDVSRVRAARAELTVAADAAALGCAPATFADFGAGSRPRRVAAETAAANQARLVDCLCALDHTWSARTATVVVATEVALLMLGSRHLETAAAAEFTPVQLVDLDR